MNKLLIVLITLFAFVGCKSSEESVSINLFSYNVVKTIMPAKSLKIVPLSSTSGIPLLAVEGETTDLNKPIQVKYCLFFQRAFKTGKGKLWLSFVSLSEDCGLNSNAILTENIDDFKISFPKGKSATQLSLLTKIKKQNHVLNIPLINLKERSQNKYAESEKITSFAPLLNVISSNTMKFKIGKEDDSFSKKTAKRCRQVNEDCETVGENLCEFCRYGWYEVVDFSCPQGGSRFCGENRCGEKGEPACPSGKKVFEIEGVSLCFDDSEAGFCQGELRPVCNDENILVCR